ncbi:hypothetical protein [Galbibacter sp.]|uniref:hypothetical protein n=1 Tax=Galbibacter sp. TaxID=2918471 RepID=UPI003A903D70
MKQEQEPLSFFEELLQYNKLSFLKDEFINRFVDNDGMDIESIDAKTGIIKYVSAFSNPPSIEPVYAITSISFQKEFHKEINTEFLKAKKAIDDFATHITQQGNNPLEYITLQHNYIITLKEKAISVYPEAPIVKSALTSLLQYIEEKYNLNNNIKHIHTVAPSIENPEDYSPHSFLWDALDNETREANLSKLYDLLTIQPKLIECQKEEFINAFSQKVVSNGIKWRVKGKNGQISKSSLFYFITSLNQGYIVEIPDTELNKRVSYTFRNAEGQPFINIRQSKNNVSANPEGKERIDQILKDVLR